MKFKRSMRKARKSRDRRLKYQADLAAGKRPKNLVKRK